MDTKEFKISVPEGYEIDKENSTFECIKFKRIEDPKWRNDISKNVCGHFIDSDSRIIYLTGYDNTKNNYNIFATRKQAKSALAMARISQIMANDVRFGGAITDEEWEDYNVNKHVIVRKRDKYDLDTAYIRYQFLAFHTREQRFLFIAENMDLIKDYLMID